MKQYSPTTPSRRHMTTVDYSVITHKKPVKGLTVKIKKNSGRNNQGRITTRHQGGENKKLYRLVDFKQQELNIPARVEGIEYDPFRTAFIARIIYSNGKRSYVLAVNNLKVNDVIMTAEKAPLKDGNRMMLKNIPVGYMVHNIELTPGKGGQIIRSAGSYAEIIAQDEGYTSLKMPSGEIRKVLWNGYASLGQLSNMDWGLVNIGKAGRSRWMGIRPTVRGSAMNPVDHPYGGGEGKAQRGTKRPKTLWGKVTGGRKTRNKKKYSSKLIIKRRK
ncbi:MAG TPA: 50S ribosomal protein L2 [Candidatus Paceibacterota bacterium]|nr:50S ribosomal protein L2 [Candidatus Paceibacterota bacterium]